jgi:hypothetical protein
VSVLDPLPRNRRELTYLFKRFAKDSEVLSPSLAFSQRRSELFPFPGTDLLVEGFPRSANTFVLHALKWSNPEFQFASHQHACGPVKYAARNHIPMLILIREPRAAVISLAMRENFRLDYCFNWYLKFYGGVEAHRDCAVIADFETATTDLCEIYARLRSRYSLALRRPPTTPSELAEVKEMVVHSHRRHSGGAVDPLRVGIPTQEKRDAVPRFEREIEASPRLSMLLDRCVAQYQRLLPAARAST